jgi:hypothetical protein
MKWWLVIAVGPFTTIAAAQQSGAVQDLQLPPGLHNFLRHTSMGFSFTPRAADAKAWEVEVRSDGSGSFRYSTAAPGPVQTINVSPDTLKIIESGSDAVEEKRCETKNRHIAQTGGKSIFYALGPSLASCDFNYSDDAALNAAANTFLALVETLQVGEELTHLHRFDRLGLDAEMAFLTEELKDGRALEVENIAATLQSIADDDRVIDRVRRQAARLLSDPPASSFVGACLSP